MSYVYIDESGETGKRSSYIVFASITTDSPRHIDKAIKRVWKAKPRLHPLGELHAYKVEDSVRNRVLKALAAQDIAVRHVGLDKSAQTRPLEHVYYLALADFIKNHPRAQVVIVDRKDTIKKRRQLIDELNLIDVFQNVQFLESHAIKPLQAVDFVAWAIGRYYELGDSTFYDIFRHLEK